MWPMPFIDVDYVACKRYMANVIIPLVVKKLQSSIMMIYSHFSIWGIIPSPPKKKHRPCTKEIPIL